MDPTHPEAGGLLGVPITKGQPVLLVIDSANGLLAHGAEAHPAAAQRLLNPLDRTLQLQGLGAQEPRAESHRART
eukprot:1152324-Pyramimonas_sp.AAC.2